MKTVINKYGKKVTLPDTAGTTLEKEVEEILKDNNVSYQMQFFFDEPGLRRKKYDAAVLKRSGEVAFLIECDGVDHYSPGFYENLGNRPERNKIHVVRVNLNTARYTRIALQKGIPILRIYDLHRGEMLRDMILAWVWTYADDQEEPNQEISAVRMLDQYGWDFDYVEPSEPSKAEKEFLEQRKSTTNRY